MARALLPKRPDNVYYRPLRKPVIDPMASRVRWLQEYANLWASRSGHLEPVYRLYGSCPRNTKPLLMAKYSAGRRRR